MNYEYSFFITNVVQLVHEKRFEASLIDQCYPHNENDKHKFKEKPYLLFAGRDHLGRSLLDIAFEYQNTELLEYLLANVHKPKSTTQKDVGKYSIKKKAAIAIQKNVKTLIGNFGAFTKDEA